MAIDTHSRDRRFRIAISAGMGTAGAIANLTLLAFLPDASLLFGGIFARGIAIAYGPLYGCLSALFTTLPSGGLHNVAVLSLETLLVGWFCRREMQPARADVLFWCVVGIPLCLFGHPDPTGSKGWSLAIRHTTSGLISIICAQVLLSFPRAQALFGPYTLPFERRSVRSYLAQCVLAATVLPLLVLASIAGSVYESRSKDKAMEDLKCAARVVASDVDDYLALHAAALEWMARTSSFAGLYTGQELYPWLKEYHQAYPGFRTILAADLNGNMLASDPPRGRGGNIADREYFKRAVSTRRRYVSDVFLGRSVGAVPVVSISVPIWRDGSIAGIMAASLDLSRFQQFDQTLKLKPFSVIALDQRDRVIYASGETPFKIFQNIAGTPLNAELRFPQKELFFRQERAPRGKPRAVFAAVYNTRLAPWRVVIQEPASHVNHDTETF